MLCLKRATVTPLLKGFKLDKEDMKRYRPISCFTFMFRLIKKVVKRRVDKY